MHSLLAVSSLQLARLYPHNGEYFLVAAANHQDIALPAYRYVISDLEHSIMDEQKGRAMVAFSSLTIVYALLCPQPAELGIPKGQSALARLSESFSLLRGAREVLAAVGDCTEGCTISSQIHDLYGDIDLSLNPDDAHLAALEPLILDHGTTTSSRLYGTDQACASALQSLRSCFAMLYLPVNPIGIKKAINIWVEAVPHTYLEALQDCRPGALVVLAHWCMLLKKGEMYWYLQDSATQVISSIYEVLDGNWRQRIAWPLRVACKQG